MSIQFLRAWNGYEQFQIATLASSEEVRLVGLGLARSWPAPAGEQGQGGLARVDPASGGLVDDRGSPVSGAGNSQAETVFPDELVSLSATGGVCGAPCYISRIRCTLGSGVVLTVFEGAASTATPLLTATLSAGQEATIPGGKLRAINGVRAVFASGAFDFYIGTEA